jgi:hypothetical protein
LCGAADFSTPLTDAADLFDCATALKRCPVKEASRMTHPTDTDLRPSSGGLAPDTALQKSHLKTVLKTRLKRMTRPSVPAEPPRARVPKSRDGKTMIAGYFTPEMARAVKILAAERNTTVQALIGEGLDRVLQTYGKPVLGER